LRQQARKRLSFSFASAASSIRFFEEKTVERVKKERGIDIFQLEDTLPATLEVECPRCGAKGKVDVGSEEVRWSL